MTRTRSKSGRISRTLSMETLENRQLMAANITASLSGGVLRVEGTQQNDTIIMRQIGNTVSIDGVRINGSGTINRIEIRGLGGNDVLRADGNGVFNQSVRIPTTIWGGTGKDFIVGGTAADQLVGGSGNDTLYGMQGNDKMWGEAGNDLMYGGTGNDELQGGAGNDELLGEAGNDSLWGQENDDWLWGGSGDDQIDGGSGSDVAYGGPGRDTFKNLRDHSFFLVHPALKSPIRGLGNLGSYGVQD